MSDESVKQPKTVSFWENGYHHRTKVHGVRGLIWAKYCSYLLICTLCVVGKANETLLALNDSNDSIQVTQTWRWLQFVEENPLARPRN